MTSLAGYWQQIVDVLDLGDLDTRDAADICHFAIAAAQTSLELHRHNHRDPRPRQQLVTANHVALTKLDEIVRLTEQAHR